MTVRRLIDRMLRAAVAAVSLALLAAACTATTDRTSTPQPSLPQRSPAAAPTLAGATRTVEPSLVLIDADGNLLRARPIDPATLADLPGYAPLGFGHHYRATVSPWRRTLAAVMYPGGTSNAGGKLHLIDVATWTDRVLETENPGLTIGLTFADEGTLYWLSEHGRLFRVDVRAIAMREIARIPDDFDLAEAYLFDDGRRLAVFGMPIVPSGGSSGIGQGMAHVFVVDLGTGDVRVVKLDGVRAGQFQTASNAPWRMLRPALGWDPPRARLFVVSAEEDRVTEIDLRAAAVVRTRTLHARASWLDALDSFLVLRAEAKVTSGDERWAAVSPDGQRLYLYGSRQELEPAANDAWRVTRIGDGLRVIDTATMAELGRVDGEVTGLALSPSGSRLVAAMIDSTERRFDEPVPPERIRIRVFDAALHELAALNAPGLARPMSFSADGARAYVRFDGDDGWRTTIVRALDVDAGHFEQERVVDRHFAEVFVAGRMP